MNYYELMVIFSSALNEEEEKNQSLQVEELLKREQATIHLMDHWGKRKLAYAVKKQRQGYYEWYYFELDPSRISEVDRKLKMSETVLRFMALRMEKIQIQNLHKETARRAEAAQAQPELPAPEPVAPAEKTETAPEPNPEPQQEA